MKSTFPGALPTHKPLAPRAVPLALCLATCGLLAACYGSEPAPVPTPRAPAVAPTLDFAFPMVSYAWDPKGGDPSVASDQGGPGFNGVGWETAATFPGAGDPRAIRGGKVVASILDWPSTLRTTGKDAKTTWNHAIAGLVYDPLLRFNDVTHTYTPNLATHWQISSDRAIYRFRLNPAARWSDGEEVTADDIVATWKLAMDPELLDPEARMTWGRFNEPTAVSKYILEVKTSEQSWRNFYYFATELMILPEHQINIGAKSYLDTYQNGFTASTGPYAVLPENIRKGESITATRRTDWWGEGNPAFTGVANFDAIQWDVVMDPQLAFEKLKKGELDVFHVQKAQWWAEEIPKMDAVDRGLILPRKFYNDRPVGVSGMAINMRRAPLDDVSVRLALQHLYDRETMIEKLFFNEYLPLVSYYQHGGYASPTNQYLGYDEVAAVALLEKAGWKELDAQGYRIKGGKRLQLSVQYASPLSERSLTVFQESAKRAGIQIDLEQLTPAARWKNALAKEFDLTEQSWGADLFPNPEADFGGTMATQVDNNNITSFSDPHVDALCTEYNREYDPPDRQGIMQEIDAAVYAAHPYVLGWYSPALRTLYWNKFGQPAWGVSRYADPSTFFLTWWIDPAMEEAVIKAKDDPLKSLDRGSQTNKYWQTWHQAGDPKPTGTGPTGG